MMAFNSSCVVNDVLGIFHDQFCERIRFATFLHYDIFINTFFVQDNIHPKLNIMTLKKITLS